MLANNEVRSVWLDGDEGFGPSFLDHGQQGVWDVAPAQFLEDADGSKTVDEGVVPRVHGNDLRNTMLGQEPVYHYIGGGDMLNNPTGYIGRTSVYRTDTYPQIAVHGFEPSVKISNMIPQHYQYIRPTTPWPWIQRAQDGEIQQIGPSIRPALEMPRYDYSAQDISYITEQQDVLLYRQLMSERGMG